MVRAPYGRGRWSSQTSDHGAVSQASSSSASVRMTGIVLGWTAPTSALALVVRNANRSQVITPSATGRVQVYPVEMPAKNASGRLSSSANHTGSILPFGVRSFSLNYVSATRHREPGPSQCRQCGLVVLRTLVTPLSIFLPCSAKTGLACPPRHQMPANAVGAVAYYRSCVIWKHARHRRQVARGVAHRPRHLADRLLALGHRKEIAQGRSSTIACSSLFRAEHGRIRPSSFAETVMLSFRLEVPFRNGRMTSRAARSAPPGLASVKGALSTRWAPRCGTGRGHRLRHLDCDPVHQFADGVSTRIEADVH